LASYHLAKPKDYKDITAMYDLIGDIHGHARELEHLLKQLGYEEREGVYRHPSRQVIFLGDLIDRGPQIARVLAIARRMVEAGSAQMVLGNHELNALAFDTPSPQKPGEYLRPRTEKNIKQHQQTLNQLSPQDLKETLAWFRTLPLWLEMQALRVVHACWHPEELQVIKHALDEHGGLSDAFLADAYTMGMRTFTAIEKVLKGPEAALPQGVSYLDKEGHRRTRMRTRWYLSPEGHTFRSYALQAQAIESDDALPQSVVAAARPYPMDAPPVFFGHYWLKAERPGTLAANVACLDYSIAKGGFLTAYRWNGESRLSDDHFVTVAAIKR
jgi:hypothetical protein